MARMYPPNLDGYQSESESQDLYVPFGERRVYELLRDGLTENEWEVFWDMRFWRDIHCILQRQIDFVICHPHWGVMLIEVKGGKYEYVPSKGGWCSIRGDDYRLDKYGGAWNQLNTAFHDFFNAQRLGYAADDLPKTMGVVLPQSGLVPQDGKLPPGANGEITADRRNCTSPPMLRAWVMLRFRELRKTVGMIDKTPNPVEGFAARELRPRVASIIPLVAIAQEAQANEQILTQEQRTILNQLRDPVPPAALVYGYAGTGKTFVAIRCADELSKTRENVVILCFNANLARQIAWTLAEIKSKAKATYFHDFCDEQVQRAGLAPPKRTGDEQADAAARVGLLEEAFVKGGLAPYDAILIDEGQDFFPQWIHTLRETVVKPAGTIAVFFDPLQDVRGIGTELPKLFGIQPFKLYVNCRNVRSLVQAMRPIFPDLAKMESPPMMPEGMQVQMRRLPVGAAEFPVLEQLVHELTDPDIHGLRPRQIVLLSPRKVTDTSLSDRKAIAGFHLQDFAMRQTEARDRIIYYETIHSFKGCEGDVVILHGIPGTSLSKELLYVAVSRARFALYVLCREDWLAPWK